MATDYNSQFESLNRAVVKLPLKEHVWLKINKPKAQMQNSAALESQTKMTNQKIVTLYSSCAGDGLRDYYILSNKVISTIGLCLCL